MVVCWLRGGVDGEVSEGVGRMAVDTGRVERHGRRGDGEIWRGTRAIGGQERLDPISGGEFELGECVVLGLARSADGKVIGEVGVGVPVVHLGPSEGSCQSAGIQIGLAIDLPCSSPLGSR